MPHPLVESIDHVMIAVRDTDAAASRWEGLGFRVRAGGAHPGMGTANAIVALGSGFYVELLAIVDREAVIGSLPGGSEFVQHVERDAEVPTTFVLSSDDLDAVAARLREIGAETVGPLNMERLDSEGRPVTWRLLIPRGVPWRRRIPVFVQWLSGSHPSDGAPRHPNGAARLESLGVTADDLGFQLRLYRDALGLPSALDEETRTLTVSVGTRSLVIRQESEPAVRGPGVVELTFAAESTTEETWPRRVAAADRRPFSTTVSRAGDGR